MEKKGGGERVYRQGLIDDAGQDLSLGEVCSVDDLVGDDMVLQDLQPE